MNDLSATEKRVKALFKSFDKLEKKGDTEKIREFAKVLEAQGLSKKRVYKYASYLKLVSKHVKVPFMNATRKDIEDFFVWMRSQKYSSNTINDTVAVLKRFYQCLRAKPE